MRLLFLILGVLLILIKEVSACPERRVELIKNYSFASCLFHYESNHRWKTDRAANFCFTLKKLTTKGVDHGMVWTWNGQVNK
jgi:hypothetical protein